MENLHQYIKQLLTEDYTPPSARGQATDHYPTLWEEEAILDQKILEERLAKRLSKDWVEPDGVRLMKKAPPPEDDGMKIDWKALHDMMENFIYSLPEALVAAELKCSVVESVLVSIARENNWEMTDPQCKYGYYRNYCPRVYKIR